MRGGRRLCFFILAATFIVASTAGQEGLGKGRLSGIVKTVDGHPIASATIVLRFLQSERLQISPHWGDPYYKLGFVYLNQENYEKAREFFKKLIEIEPSSQRTKKVKEILKDLDKLKK
jgi:hypothetical protein